MAYALLEGVEAVGLWLAKRWAEYLTFLATTILLAAEVYEIVHEATVLKVIGFLINLAVVVYLLFASACSACAAAGRRTSESAPATWTGRRSSAPLPRPSAELPTGAVAA